MADTSGPTVSRDDSATRGVSTVAALAAFAGAVVLAFLLYGLVGFPENIPLAFGASVLLVEIVDSMVRGGTFSKRRIARAIIHGIIVAGACWLGVWIAEFLGWTG